MNYQRYKEYKRYKENAGYVVGERAKNALRAVKIIEKFNSISNVAITVEPEVDNYFDAYGKPDSEREYKSICHYLDLYGCWIVKAEYQCKECNSWIVADTIGMCVYNNPADPFENDYVVGLMQSAIEHVEDV